MKIKRNIHTKKYLKLVSAIFDQIFVYHQMIALQKKKKKNSFYFI